MKVVLISMDCVRPDYLTHPFFERLKAEGTLFKCCITSAPHTSTSHTSILTGCYPFNHGVRWIIKYSVKRPMIQELLVMQGFKTGAFIGGFPLTQGDLDRGFDTFISSPTVNDTQEGRGTYVPANILVQQAIDFLTENSKKNVFIFIHFFDAHLTLRSEFDINTERPEKDATGRYVDIEKYLGRRKVRYQEEVDFIGTQIKRLVELAPIDLLVITSDHGEKMEGELNYPWVYNSQGKIVGSHFHEVELFDIQIKVPLIFWGKNIKNKNIEQMVRTIDIAPTIISMITKKRYRYKVDGISLYPALTSDLDNGIKDNSAYSETYFAQVHENNIHTIEKNKEFRFGWKDIDNLISLRTNEWKLICTANERLEPYLLFKIDIDEWDNLLKSQPEVVRRLFNQLKELLKDDFQYLRTPSLSKKFKFIATQLKEHKKV